MKTNVRSDTGNDTTPCARQGPYSSRNGCPQQTSDPCFFVANQCTTWIARFLWTPILGSKKILSHTRYRVISCVTSLVCFS